LLNPTRKPHVCDADGRVDDPKLRSSVTCVSWDHFLANTNAARTVNVYTQVGCDGTRLGVQRCRKWSLNERQRPNARGVRVALGTERGIGGRLETAA
jgi:hypothetical protein